MADISRTKNHSMDIASVKERVERIAGEIATKMGVKYAWNGDICELTGAGLKSGTITVTDTTVSIELTLGMMAKMMKPIIEKEIDQKIDQIVG
jgi:putative polyhydroxyalkanoate system protein